ncbi:unnamed protein product [Nippostrongylus brasiliensis]|uniref:SCP domain-containing protein n=1 Tax=Nippostrongylus brasiliensis TaxID=27835 RepID=A0A0N4YKP6_NIPBR|nr:unnamed protein product [Nippostrongylus brasiliensis]
MTRRRFQVLLVTTVTAYLDVHQCSSMGLTEDERLSVLTMYNIARLKAARGIYFPGNKLPTAKNMRALTWDCELENLAEKAVFSCPDAETPRKDYAQHFRHMIANVPDKVSALEPIVQPTEDPSEGFTTESSSVVYNGNSIYRSYANLMRSSTTKMGCSVRVCEGKGVLVQTGICLFNTPEMEKGDKVYEVGKSCETAEECPNGDDVCIGRGLCYRNKFAKRALHLHNKRRSDLALGNVKDKSGKNFPTTALMSAMEISFNLEAQALKKARNWEHDPTGFSSHQYSPNDVWTSRIVVQNAVDEIDALEQALKTWWNQRKLVDDQVKKKLFENAFLQPAVMEFAQMAYGDNNVVGCAADKRGNQYNVVCQYYVGPCGSKLEDCYAPLYVPGPKCQQCYSTGRPCSQGMCPGLYGGSYLVFTDMIRFFT